MKEMIKEALEKAEESGGYFESMKAHKMMKWQHERIEQLEKALEEAKSLILITQEIDESPSLRHNAANMALYKINQALGKE